MNNGMGYEKTSYTLEDLAYLVTRQDELFHIYLTLHADKREFFRLQALRYPYDVFVYLNDFINNENEHGEANMTIGTYKKIEDMETVASTNASEVAGPSAPVSEKLRDATTDSLAGELYSVYSEAVGGVNFQGDALPIWDEFSADEAKKKQADAWIAVAQHIIDEYK